MRIASGGNVGIGVSSPSNPLSVLGSAGTIASFTNGADADLLIKAQSAVTTLTPSTGTLAFGTSDTERMRIDSSGRLLVGTSSVGYSGVDLTVGDTADSQNGIAIQTSTTGYGYVLFGDGTGTDAFRGQLYYKHGDDFMAMHTAGAERMRIESDGNLRVYDSIDNLTGTLTLNGRNTGQIRFESGGSLKMLMDGSGHLGIGVSSVAAPLHVSKSINNYVARFENSDASNPYTVWIREPASASAGYPLLNVSDNAGSSTYFRVDSGSGNLLAGTTDSDTQNNNAGSTADNGFVYNIGSGGYLNVARYNGTVAYFNRTGADGTIADFRKDGTSVGSIAVQNSTLQIGTSNTNLSFSDANDALYIVNAAGVERDGDTDLGKNDARFDDIYATNGTIQTSDRNEKQDIEALSEAEQRVAVACKGLLRKFRWKDAVEEKGDDARIHFGIIAQDLQDAFTAEGLDAGRYGMFINSTWTDEETGEERSRMGVRYSELLAFIISAI
jgi:hypothetical protein